MENLKVISSLNQICKEFPSLNAILSNYLFKQTWENFGSQSLLNELCDLLLIENYTIRIAELFSPILLELLVRISESTDENSVAKHEWLSLSLSKLIWYFPEAERFTRSFFEKSFDLFFRFKKAEGFHGKPAAKRRKKEHILLAKNCQILKAAYIFLLYDTPFFKDQWDWKLIVPLMKDADEQTRWYAYHCLAQVSNVPNSSLSRIMNSVINEHEFLSCAKEGFDLSSLWNYSLYSPFRGESKLSRDDFVKFVNCDFSKNTVNVYGALLPREAESEGPSTKLVCVTPVKEALYKMALAVSAGKSVLLQGPVGSGKTSLVEHLAALTGRKQFEDLLKVQLGDHMDSKMLLGTYCCTEIPGEFVWKPGILVEAMTQGHWLLMEDIESAPMDVVSQLVPILESRSVLLPGHSSPIKAVSGFQLFATQRLLTGKHGSYLEFRNSFSLIEKKWRKIQIDALSMDNLKQVILAKWQILEPVISRILEIFSLFSPDFSNAVDVESDSMKIFASIHKQGRLISTRDLFKFCERVAPNFDNSSGGSPNLFQSAIECFADSIPCPATRLRAAEAIGVKFNIPKSRVSFYCQKNLPAVKSLKEVVQVGRTMLRKRPKKVDFKCYEKRSVFAHTQQASQLLEKVAVAISNQEPVLLVGETGTGKTSIVQHLAELTGHKLTVINMSQQSDSVDLLGGYKPVDFYLSVKPVKESFESLFCSAMDAEKNASFLQHVSNCFYKKKYQELFELMLHAQKNAIALFRKKHKETGMFAEKLNQWSVLGHQVMQLKKQLQQSKSSMSFQFVEGALVSAMRRGEWLLLDEINLAEAETLECLSSVLDKDDNMLLLLEKGTKERIHRDDGFRIFACMNPSTDIGKKDLPAGVRSRFSEFFVDEIEDKNNLRILVQEYLKGLSVNTALVENIVEFYVTMKSLALGELSDGTGHRPHFSLRTLCRALKYASTNPCLNVSRSLYEAFCLSFLSQLSNESHAVVTQNIASCILGNNKQSILKQSIPEPRHGKYIPVEGHWILSGKEKPSTPENYILTKAIKRNLRDLSRIVSAGCFPVLLQGETSVGKTSLVQWLAKVTGNTCIRINNHEHTDIQEYIGTYSADEKGNLVFKEGILVDAMRNGYWIILDELNLAPSEVMEALNRVLDDNRELFIPETQTTVRAQPGFMVFATQNPAGRYGGRKLLSRAFRNRFIELHFNEIPSVELKRILAQRCELADSHAFKLVAVMHELQMRRRESGVFAGKQGYITLRDLFRWGERCRNTPPSVDWAKLYAEEGYMLLAGRVRHPHEEKVIVEVLEKHFKWKVDPDELFILSDRTSPTTRHILEKVQSIELPDGLKNVVWTSSMQRLAALMGKAIEYKEPVLLVGSTGCGKTTLCQIFAHLYMKTLYSVNCHMHSESSDFLGGLRPVRGECKDKLFEWMDGPLVLAMQQGDFFLTDEISLADDSVLERLNSVLEPEQKILISEKCFGDSENFEIAARDGFQLFATMNPGGDFGKKELSPALRNRFTEIWCPDSISNSDDVAEIVEHNIKKDAIHPRYVSKGCTGFGVGVAQFVSHYFKTPFYTQRRMSVSIRDVLTWVEFINMSQPGYEISAFIHGAFLLFIDNISIDSYLAEEKNKILRFLLHQIGSNEVPEYLSPELILPESYADKFSACRILSDAADVEECEEEPVETYKPPSFFGIGPFIIECGTVSEDSWKNQYILEAKTPKTNLLRILRAMQLPKPILLEGSPGVGKTSLVSVLAEITGHHLVRINLSEQTDVSDLFGADLPKEGGERGQFEWHDGPLLQAIIQGDWILLDELNLASQSVLEGLNACLDHRSELHIPELGRTFHIEKRSSRIFGCQNPYFQGGSRKGLPQSFLNRFTQVYMNTMELDDMECIAAAKYDVINPKLLSAMVEFNNSVSHNVNVAKRFGRFGSPWEFNLRDVFRWCELMIQNQPDTSYDIGEYMELIYADRMRTVHDKDQVCEIFTNVIKRHGLDSCHAVKNRQLQLNVFEECVQLGYSMVPCKGRNRSTSKMLAVAHDQLPCLESLMKCIEMNWMAILIGPSGSGKSTLARLLADLCGQELHIMSVNSEMDTIEILGGYEQSDLSRKIERLYENLEPLTQEAIFKGMSRAAADKNVRHLLQQVLTLIYRLSNVKRKLDVTQDRNQYCLSTLELLKNLVDLVEHFNVGQREALAFARAEISRLSRALSKNGSTVGGQFEWVDSILVQAVLKGHWLLIDDANFCSPSVLDRLNPLLEPNGSLTMNEQGTVNGKLRVIKPHKDFRIILTMDPKNGEISRAMRNRGIEIYVAPINIQETDDKMKLFDATAFAQCQGLVHYGLLQALLNIHQGISFHHECNATSLTDFTNAAALCVQLLQKHEPARSALRNACDSVYVCNNLHIEGRKAALQIIEQEVERFNPKHIYSHTPIPSIVATNLDLRQDVGFANIKNLSSIFTFYLNRIIDSHISSTEEIPISSSSYPIPDILGEGEIFCEKKLLIHVMQIMFSMCSLKMSTTFDAWFQFLYEKVKKCRGVGNESLMAFLQEFLLGFTVEVKKMFEKNMFGSIQFAQKITYQKITSKELPFDTRWNFNVLKRITSQTHLQKADVDAIEHLVTAFANRYNLYLFLKVQAYVNVAESKADRTGNSLWHLSLNKELGKKMMCNRYLQQKIVSCLPDFLSKLYEFIHNLLRSEEMIWNNDFFWEVHDVIYAYYTCCRVCRESCSNGVDSQVMLFVVHFHSMQKRLFEVCSGKTRIISAIEQIFNPIEKALGCKLNQKSFCTECTKVLGRQKVFSGETTYEIYNQVKVLFHRMDLRNLLKLQGTSIEGLSAALTNRSTWCGNLTDVVYKSIYDSPELNILEARELTEVVRRQAEEAGLLQQAVWKPPENPMDAGPNASFGSRSPSLAISDIAAELQLLPLWDYLFVLHESELIARFLILVRENLAVPPEKDSSVMDHIAGFLMLGIDVLGISPQYAAHLYALQESELVKKTYCYSTIDFLHHTRSGFSSSNLVHCYQPAFASNSESQDNKITKWNSHCSWAKQQPLLTQICINIFGRPSHCSLMSHTPLESHLQKKRQLEILNKILWTQYERFHSAEPYFQKCTSNIILTWFDTLVDAVVLMSGSEAVDNPSKETVVKLFHRAEAPVIELTKNGKSIVTAAYDLVQHLRMSMRNPGFKDKYHDLQYEIGCCYVFVGLLTYIALMPLDLIDPAMKQMVKMDYLNIKLKDLIMDKKIREWITLVLSGQRLDDIQTHPFVNELTNMCENMTMALISLEKNVAFRPNQHRYQDLKGDARSFYATVGNPDDIFELHKVLDASRRNNDSQNLRDLNTRIENWCKNVESCIENMSLNYPEYYDVMSFFLLGLEQIVFGFRMMIHSAHYKNCCVLFPFENHNGINSFLDSVPTFASTSILSPMTVSNLLIHSHGKALLYLFALGELSVGKHQYKLVKSSILEMVTELKIRRGRLEAKTGDIMDILISAFHFLYKIWSHEEAKVKHEKEKMASLYKQRVHKAERSEEEEISRKMAAMFPSYQKDFQDLFKAEDDMEDQPIEDDLPEDLYTFTANDLYEISQLHATAISLLAYAYDKADDESSSSDLDVVTPYLLRHDILCGLVSAYGEYLNASLDAKLLPGQLLMCRELKNSMEQDAGDMFDIYRDPCPAKAATFFPILIQLASHAVDLLTHFEDHPTLVQVLVVTRRVLSFPISAPIMKFVVGFELILETAQLWEQNAHHKVSLKMELDVITKTIIEYRSLELNGWRTGLHSVIKKQNVNAAKWWFHMFPLLSLKNPVQNAEFVETSIRNGIIQLLEDSPLGEFSARLKILQAFLEQMKYYLPDENLKNIPGFLHNTCLFYSQFLPNVESSIAQIQKQIEKEIKDFVKIARWNDMNFFSVKQSVEKSHRFVVKHVKAFEDALKRPARELFVLPSKGDASEDPWALSISLEKNPGKNEYEQSQLDYFANRPGKVFQKIPAYFGKMKKIVRRMSKAFPPINQINSFNDFCGNVIDALQSANSTAGKSYCTRAREKKQILLGIQNKKQMLSILFKNLKVMGLSYRKGRILAADKRVTDTTAVTPPLDVLEMKILKFDRNFEKMVSTASSDTDHYFFKCIAQYTHLKQLMASPCKDLNLDITHRIEGYSSDLLHIASTQRESISTLTKKINRVGCFLQNLKTLSTERGQYQKQHPKQDRVPIPSQTFLKQFKEKYIDYFVNFRTALSEFKALMECAPLRNNIPQQLNDILIEFSQDFLPEHKNDKKWNEVNYYTRRFEIDIKKQFNLLTDKLEQACGYYSWKDLSWLSCTYKYTSDSTKHWLQLINETGFNLDCSLTKKLLYLAQITLSESDKCIELSKEHLNEATLQGGITKNTLAVKKITGLCQKLAAQILLAFNDMVNCYSSKEKKMGDDVVEEGLLTVRLCKAVDDAEKVLHLQEVVKLMNKLTKSIDPFRDSLEDLKSIHEGFRCLLNLTPLLTEYFELLKVYLCTSLGMHRTTNKFLSILLQIFGLLAEKGFCIPPELEEEAQKSGATKFEDIEAGGLGEGEGTKDVSENIKTEDQLEDTFKEGEERKEKDEEEKSDVKDEEKGIEMSEDFEGKSYDPEEKNEDSDSDQKDEDMEEDDLDKQMGEVDNEFEEKIEEKNWGDDSEDENEEEKESKESGGVTQDQQSEMAAKEEDLEKDDGKNKKEKAQEELGANMEDEECATAPDPMIDQPQQKDSDIHDLPEDMEIVEEMDYGDENAEEIDESMDKEDSASDDNDDSEGQSDVEEIEEPEVNGEEMSGVEEIEMKNNDEKKGETHNVEEDDDEEGEDEDQNGDEMLPAQGPDSKDKALPAPEEVERGSAGAVDQNDKVQNGSTDAQDAKEQHKEGMADAQEAKDAGHQGKKSSSMRSNQDTESQQHPRLKPPSENRILAEESNDDDVKQRPVRDQRNVEEHSESHPGGVAEIYEHVSREEDGTSEAADTATERQAAERPPRTKTHFSDDEEVIEILSTDEEEEEEIAKAMGDAMCRNPKDKAGKRGDSGKADEGMEIDEDDSPVILTQNVPRGPDSTIHTRYELWHSEALGEAEQWQRGEEPADGAAARKPRDDAWRELEGRLAYLYQELYEQMRLVLEPTKSTKFRGDYRTGKRLNMRKIIPYIASQFRKDKIWMRRTKPSKREYLIMLALDNSSSMSANRCEQLCCESVALLSQALTLLEAGELCMISYGETVTKLLSFSEQYSSRVGARISASMTFKQEKTNLVEMLRRAAELMAEARGGSHSLMSRETAQLLIILSDGHGVNSYGDAVKKAVRRAREDNIFIIYVIFDNPAKNKPSVLDVQRVISLKPYEVEPYMDSFPFPFYIILRNISDLPHVLGEALRQWFELVTSVER